MRKKSLKRYQLSHLAPGDFVTIIGGNGAGKSTMLNMIAGVYPIDSGKIEIDGVNISREPEYKRAKYIGRVFQDPMRGTAANMEIQENLAMALRRGKSSEDSAGASKRMKRTSTVRALAQLDMGLQTRMTSKVGLLSGGQR
ncbi:MAG: ATP-binding cassette domain-containing protein [Clostridium fessum]